MGAYEHSKGQVKLKVTLEQVTKAQRGTRVVALLFNLDARWWLGGQRHDPTALPPQKSDPVRVVQEAGWALEDTVGLIKG